MYILHIYILILDHYEPCIYAYIYKYIFIDIILGTAKNNINIFMSMHDSTRHQSRSPMPTIPAIRKAILGHGPLWFEQIRGKWWRFVWVYIFWVVEPKVHCQRKNGGFSIYSYLFYFIFVGCCFFFLVWCGLWKLFDSFSLTTWFFGKKKPLHFSALQPLIVCGPVKDNAGVAKNVAFWVFFNTAYKSFSNDGSFNPCDLCEIFFGGHVSQTLQFL